MSERWLPVPGFPGYDVSDLGHVRSWRIKGGKPRRVPRLLKTRKSKDSGYLHLSILRDGKQVNMRVHVLVMRAFVGPRPEGMETRHLNGNAGDSRLSNLAYGTHTENMQDAVRHGTLQRRVLKTVCRNGHPYDEVNTHRLPDGSRRCRICHRECRRRSSAALRASRQAEAA